VSTRHGLAAPTGLRVRSIAQWCVRLNTPHTQKFGYSLANTRKKHRPTASAGTVDWLFYPHRPAEWPPTNWLGECTSPFLGVPLHRAIGTRNRPPKSRKTLVLPGRIELTTSPLPRGCSTTELRQPGTRPSAFIVAHPCPSKPRMRPVERPLLQATNKPAEGTRG
jgi:hypothetical protein